jgi:hypothetical protein
MLLKKVDWVIQNFSDKCLFFWKERKTIIVPSFWDYLSKVFLFFLSQAEKVSRKRLTGKYVVAVPT